MSTAAMARHRIRCRLQQWLDERGLNYSQLADQIEERTGSKVSLGAIRRLAREQFDRIDCSNADEISRFFGKTFEEMFYTEEQA